MREQVVDEARMRELAGGPVEGEAEAADPSAPARPVVRLSSQSVPRWAVIGIFLMLLVAGIAYARVFLIPVVFGFLLALVFSPVRRFLDRRGIPSGLSAFFIVGSLAALLLMGLSLLADPVAGWVDDAPRIVRELQFKVRSLLGSASAVVEASQQVEEIAKGTADEDVQEVVVRQPSVLTSVALETPAMLSQAVFALILLLFVLASGDMFYEKIVHAMPTFRDKRRAIRIAYDIERKLSRYFFTITLINAGLGIAVGTTMWALGMPNALLFGVIAFSFNYVPYVGALAGIAIAGVVGLMTFDQIGPAVLPAAAYFTLTTIEGQLVTPYFVGRRLEMNTVVIFLAITFWAWLWSAMGMLVAVPMLVAVRAFCEHIPRLEPLGNFLSARGSESVAKDDEEAV
ncbi:MAG: AI-2E family transporter [Geminicoccaceae bacterium]|nr:AI-2E family transporter [Geminicoccaceae bacterium]